MKLNKQLITGIGGGVVLLVVVIVIAGSRAKKSANLQYVMETKLAKQQAPRPVQFERVQARATEKTRSYPGIVQASDESALSFRVGGPLTEVTVELGKPVKKGDLLMQIDPRDFKDRVLALEAQLAGASAQYRNAQQDYVRMAKLFNQQVVPQSDYDHAANAQAAAEAGVKTLTAQLAMARHALADTSLRAPYDGTVTAQLAENNEMVESGNVVLHYHNIQVLEVTVSVPENEVITRSMDHAKATVSFSALGDKPFEARLKEWSSAADPMTRTYAVTFEFNAPAAYKVLPGMSANIQWVSAGSEEPVFTLPVSAILRQPDGSSAVWVLDEATDHPVKRAVTVGPLVGSSRVIISAGVTKGEQVVVAGSRLIHEALLLKAAQK